MKFQPTGVQVKPTFSNEETFQNSFGKQAGKIVQEWYFNSFVYGSSNHLRGSDEIVYKKPHWLTDYYFNIQITIPKELRHWNEKLKWGEA